MFSMSGRANIRFSRVLVECASRCTAALGTPASRQIWAMTSASLGGCFPRPPQQMIASTCEVAKSRAACWARRNNVGEGRPFAQTAAPSTIATVGPLGRGRALGFIVRILSWQVALSVSIFAHVFRLCPLSSALAVLRHLQPRPLQRLDAPKGHRPRPVRRFPGA